MNGATTESDTKGQRVDCPECEAVAIAVVPENAIVVSSGNSANGSVWVNCKECGERFRVYFTTEE